MTRACAVVAFLVVAVVAATVPAFANGWSGHGDAYTTDSGVGWYYSEARKAFFTTPASFEPVAGGPALEWSHVPTCAGNTPGGSDNRCLGALCTAPDGEPGVSVWVFSRPTDPPGADWNPAGTQCVAGEQRIDLADVEAQVRRVVEDRFRSIAQPVLHLAPDTTGLVNLPMLAWTDDPGPVTLDFTQPLPGTITATPSYDWSWSNGTHSTGPGRPYTPSQSPSAAPESYVHAVFAERGEGAVTLTVTWQAAVTVPGLPTPIDIAPLVYTSQATFSIREARAQLVDPYL